MPPLQKQPVSINFAKGLDLKTDPFQVPIGSFLSLENSVFTTGDLLQKRNGFAPLTPLPNATSTYLTTFNGNLTAIGTELYALVNNETQWVDKGTIQPVELNTLPLIRSNTNQSYASSSVSSTNLVCTVFIDNIPSGSTTTPAYKYVVADAVTGQNISPPQIIPIGFGTIVGSPKVVTLLNNFLILVSVFDGTKYFLKYLRVSLSTPQQIASPVTISNHYLPVFDIAVINDTMFATWAGSDNAIHVTAVLSNLQQINTIIVSGYTATSISITGDTTGMTPRIYVSFYDSISQNGYTFSIDGSLNIQFAPVATIVGEVLANLTSSALNGAVSIFYEIVNFYSYDMTLPTNYLKSVSVSSGGTASSPVVLVRSVGLFSDSFIVGEHIYVLCAYQSVFQPTYFLINDEGDVVAKLAYSNGGGYATHGLTNVTVTDTTAKIAYLVKDLISAVNKTQGAANAAGIYSQTGINLASFDVDSNITSTAEIGQDLHLTGGFLWMYDGYTPVEHLYHVWPDNVEGTWSTTGGSMQAQPDGSTNDDAYFYQVTYEWSDNQGNVFRSAPSIPLSISTTGSASTGSVTLNIPTLRLTYKIANPVKIVIYRWSVGQQVYYQTTSIQVPTLNDTTIDSIEYIDKLADSSILGNDIIYTTGGVVENIPAPAVKALTLFDTRLFYIDAEDQNLLGFSKQVIESTPVETSDLFTIFVSPTSAAQGPTGPMQALAPLDDKLVIFKKNAIYYINGKGPDNTGASSQYSEPTFITATVGSDNQKSIVFMPSGLMFQSDKGIWLLGRDLSTSYIGAPVETFTQNATVLSANNIPETNQVRFTMDSGITLMYDYYYGQWGTFTNIPSIASTLYEDLQTYINAEGQAFQEKPGHYLDGSNPVLMSFKTSWISLAGLQGYERFYEMLMLGKYYSPFKLGVELAYDYSDSPSQQIIVSPDNYNGPYGSLPIYGDGTPYGGNSNVFNPRIFPSKQKCETFQVAVKEIYDPSFGVISGAGLTLSGLNLVIGVKKGYRTSSAGKSFG